MIEQPAPTTVADPLPPLGAPKVNPYAEQLAASLADALLLRYEEAYTAVQWLIDNVVTPKNKRVHGLHIDLARLQASVARLGKVLDRHNEGEWHKDKESAIDCAIRLLSPVPDNTPKRDRP